MTDLQDQILDVLTVIAKAVPDSPLVAAADMAATLGRSPRSIANSLCFLRGNGSVVSTRVGSPTLWTIREPGFDPYFISRNGRKIFPRVVQTTGPAIPLDGPA